MDPFKFRLIEEQAQLRERIEKLAKFIWSDTFKTIDSTQQLLLKVQLKAMETYASCLEARINQLENY